MTRPLSDLDRAYLEAHAQSLALHQVPPECDASPEAEAADIRAARRGFTHPADTD